MEQNDVRTAVMGVLHEAEPPGRTAKQISRAVGLDLASVYEVLTTMRREGVIEASWPGHRGSPGGQRQRTYVVRSDATAPQSLATLHGR